MTRIHEALSGHRIEYSDPDPKVAKFLERASAMLEDRKATAKDLVALVYGPENPILAPGTIPGAGLVTKDVLENPVYHVLADIIFRKQVAQGGVDIERIAARFTLSAAEAAERKGVSVDAIRAAARERRLSSWSKDGAYFFDPKALDAAQLGTRGPLPKATEPLVAKVGYDRDDRIMLSLKAPSYSQIEGPAPDGASWNGNQVIERWRRVGVLTGGKGKLRFFELEPSTDENEIKFGKFYVRGRFGFVRKVNGAAAARKAWDTFVGS
jgi:hypothetical protein